MKRSEFKNLAGKVDISKHLDYKEWLTEIYLTLKAAKGSYTYSNFAEDLGFPPSNVIDHIMKGRRNLTLKSAQRIMESLSQNANEKAYLSELIIFNNSTDEKKGRDALRKMFALKDKFTEKDEDKLSLKFFSAWYHPVICEMSRLEDFSPNPELIRKRLHELVSRTEIEESLNLLEEMKLIEFEADRKKVKRTSVNPSTGSEVRGISTLQFHSQMLAVSEKALFNMTSKNRDFSSLTLAVDDATMEKLKSIIHEFQNEILSVEEKCETPTQLIQLNTQLFSLLKNSK